jgi:pimeloyl-ACP methyl ester carboxylesterase
MKNHLLINLIFLALVTHPIRSHGSDIPMNKDSLPIVDTMVDVGGYRLHFRIIEGSGTPILFESGSGTDLSTWDTILRPLAHTTHATLITYERAGFGKSELDSSNVDVDKHGLLQGVEALKTGLEKLGYHGKIMLVASSFGGFYATLFAARNPQAVKATVLIDANLACWFTDEFVKREMDERKKTADSIKKNDLGYYYQSLNLENNIHLMRKTPFPASIPVTDLVAEFNFPDSASAYLWKRCHKEFAAAQPNREVIVVKGAGHIIYRDYPSLVIRAIARLYLSTADTK